MHALHTEQANSQLDRRWALVARLYFPGRPSMDRVLQLRLEVAHSCLLEPRWRLQHGAPPAIAVSACLTTRMHFSYSNSAAGFQTLQQQPVRGELGLLLRVYL